MAVTGAFSSMAIANDPLDIRYSVWCHTTKIPMHVVCNICGYVDN